MSQGTEEKVMVDFSKSADDKKARKRREEMAREHPELALDVDPVEVDQRGGFQALAPRDPSHEGNGSSLPGLPDPLSGPLALSPSLMERVRRDAGRGLSQKQEDNLLPMIVVLQAQSPACDPDHQAHVPGAERGAFWLKNSPVPIIKGKEGILFVPAAMELAWVEWRPRTAGGGFIAKHREPPQDTIQIQDPKNPEKRKWVRKGNGHEMIETRYRYGLVILEGLGMLPFVIPFTSTGHTVCRGWETTMNSLFIPGTNDRYPSFAGCYRLRTKQRTNASGTWHQIDVALERAARDQEYERAEALCEAFEKEELSVDTSQMEEAGMGPSQVTQVGEEVPF
jgi:hypothetical protein